MIRHAAQLAAVAALFTCALESAPNAQAGLPNRVAAGEVNPNTALLWARATAQGALQFEVSEDPTFQSNVLVFPALVTSELLPVKRRVGPLLPGRTYHYRATDAAGASDVGSFRTPHAQDGVHGLRFGVTGDGRGDNLPFHSIANVPAAALDFLVYLGDTIYADVPSQQLPIAQAFSRRAFLLKHDEVTGFDAAGLNFLGDARASTAFLATIDDHEVTNDFSGGAHPSTMPIFDPTGSFINETVLYENGVSAFQDYYPLANAYYGDTGDARTAFKRKLYRKAHYGLDASVFVLDARSFRDAPLPEADLADPLSVFGFLAASFDPSRTMLGRVQVDELKADLLAADQAGVTWKFVMVPEPIQNLGVLAAGDRFEGYAAERTEILDFVHTNDIDNVVFVCADIHGTLVNDLSYQLGVGQPQIKTNAFEISTGAVAYDAPFGPTVVELGFFAGLVTAEQKAFYDSLPGFAKDSFVKSLVDSSVATFGYDPLGLEGSLVQAQLLGGDYLATHVWGWTEFEIDAATQALTVTTWGIEPFASSAPTVRSQFVVTPQ